MTTDLQQLVRDYVHARNDYMHNVLLEKLVEITKEQNFRQILQLMQSYEITDELDISLYLSEITINDYKGLKNLTQSFLDSFEDPDAIEDLEMAIKNLSK
ncbi:hypothetical protein AB2B38_013625 [Balneola sp. MJW-20]|uniref:hypothetical protein n=1 Tax=Gracilimonas aurantiaca TaxID=3234185 RepID=UPI003467C438